MKNKIFLLAGMLLIIILVFPTICLAENLSICDQHITLSSGSNFGTSSLGSATNLNSNRKYDIELSQWGDFTLQNLTGSLNGYTVGQWMNPGSSNVDFGVSFVIPATAQPGDITVINFILKKKNWIFTSFVADIKMYIRITDEWQGWELISSEYGGGGLPSYSKLYPGDFDNDGAEEILGVQGSWMTLFNYNSTTNHWDWTWSNYGSTSHAMYPYRNQMVIGDFDGDGDDETLGHGGTWITMFEFNGSDFVWKWSTYGNTSLGITPYSGKLIAGNFDGSDSADEVLGVGGWVTMFHFNGTDFQWGWSNYGNHHDINPYQNYLQAGDFNGDGDDEVIGAIPNGWVTTFDFNGNNFVWKNSNYGSSSFAGWHYPFASNDVMLIGDIDCFDSKDELFFIERGNQALWALTADLSNGNFSMNTSNGGNGFIGDWSLLYDPMSYLLVKAEANEPECLIAREYNCRGRSRVKMYKSKCINRKEKSRYMENEDEILTSAEAVSNVDVSQNRTTIDSKNERNNMTLNELTLYPNPTKGHLTLEHPFVSGKNYIVNLSNLLGEQLLQIPVSNEQSELDLSRFPTGSYILQLSDGEQVWTEKVIITK